MRRIRELGEFFKGRISRSFSGGLREVNGLNDLNGIMIKKRNYRLFYTKSV